MGWLGYIVNLHRRMALEQQEKEKNKLLLKELPHLYGLLTIAISSGVNINSSLAYVKEYVPLGFEDIFKEVLTSIESGTSFASALGSFNDNEHLRPLSHILVESLESGSSALPALDALHRDSLDKIRRYCDIALKKLPVTMLFPLVICILPSFILLGVIPTLLYGFSTIQW